MTPRLLFCLDALVYLLVTVMLGLAGFFGGVGAGLVLVVRSVHQAWAGAYPSRWTPAWQRRLDAVGAALGVVLFVVVGIFSTTVERMWLVGAMALMLVPIGLRRLPSVRSASLRRGSEPPGDSGPRHS